MNKNAKPRILYLLRILERYSDEENPLTTKEIIRLLKEEYGIEAHRTTLPADFEILREYGVDIISNRSAQNEYYIGDRQFEIVELKLLIDAVESSKFITEKKSKELIQKLIATVSVNQTVLLKRNLIVSGRVKPSNEMIYYIADAINTAINDKKQIKFQYQDYGPTKVKKLRHGGQYYVLSPYKLIWNDDFYYVIGFSEVYGKVIKFRVDRIAATPEILNEQAMPIPEDFNIVDYAKSVFFMYDGEPETVELRCMNDMMNTIVDRFGEDVKITAYDKESFRAVANVSTSPTFFGWIFGFGGKIQIIGPAKVKQTYVDMIKKAYRETSE